MLQQQQAQQLNPHAQQQAHSLKCEPISVQKHIGKPKQLILQKSINKVYHESWMLEEVNKKTINVKEAISSIKNKQSSTQLQTRLTYKTKARNQGYRSQKYDCSKILTLKQLQEEGAFGQLVYQRGIKKDNWNWSLKSAPVLQAQNKNSMQNPGCVQFNSCFESGNLLRAYLSTLQPQTYSLITHCDTNTNGYNQWFYFKARCCKPFTTMRFQIVNLRKKHSCFSKGMKIAVFSNQKQKEEKIGWHRAGFNIEYTSNQIRSPVNEKLNTLSWEYTFEYKDQWVYFAYSYPYTYTDLIKFISKTKKYKQQAEWVTISFSALKNEIYMIRFNHINQDESSIVIEPNSASKIIEKYKQFNKVSKGISEQSPVKFKRRQLSFNDKVRNSTQSQTINNDSSLIQISPKKRLLPLKNKSSIKPQEKQILLVLARAHPGETPSSFIVQGVIDSLLSECDSEIKYLKQKLSIYVIPILNPDGVIHGNSRVSLTGNDLNRRWKNPHEKLHPQVHAVKQFVKDLVRKGKKIFAMIDLHAHTKKQSVFLYGCCDNKNYHNRAQVKLLNQLMGKCDSNFNSLFSSHFVSESKRSTARVVFYRQFKCLSYTIEASFLGASGGSFHFSVSDYHKIGRNLLKSLAYLHLATIKNIKNKTNFTINQILLNNSILKQTLLDYFDRHRRFGNTQEQTEDRQSDGSSSAPSACNFTEKQLLLNLFPRLQYSNKTIKSSSRYSLQKKKVFKLKNQISMLLDDQEPQISQQFSLSQSPVKMQKRYMGIRKHRNENKLPLINSVQSKGELFQDVPQFQAFNFITKSRRYSNKKTFFQSKLNGSYDFKPENTID